MGNTYHLFKGSDQLINKTGVNVADISLDDFEVGMLLGGKGQISSLGIPEFDNEYARSAAKELEVESFTDVVQLIVLMMLRKN